MLDKLLKMVTELNTTNSSNKKMEILSQYNDQDIKDLLVYTYDDINKKYGITSKNLIKRDDLVSECPYTIIEVLDMLDSRQATGHAAISLVNGFIAKNTEYKDLVYMIIDRKLKTRTNITAINKVFVDLIPTFNVALADELDKMRKHVDFNKQIWYASRKLDGCRCVIIHNAKGTKAISRQGKEFYTLNKITSNFKLPYGVYDGEICIVDENGDENYKGIMQEIRKSGDNKTHTIAKPRYKIFDCLTEEEFYSRKSTRTFSERLEHLKSVYVESEYTDVCEQTLITSEEQFEEMRLKAAELGWEGLIVREDVPYAGRRSRHMLKAKMFIDGEFVIQDTYNTTKRMIINGVDTPKDCLAGITIKYFPDLEPSNQMEGTETDNDLVGYSVDVGSGWSDAERLEYFASPEKLVGKIITVRWFVETENKKGEKRIQFPTKKWLFDGERDV